MIKIKGCFKFLTTIGKMIITVDDEWWQRASHRDSWDFDTQNNSLKFSLKKWLFEGGNIKQSIPLEKDKFEYKDFSNLDYLRGSYYRPPITIALSNMNAIIIQEWTNSADNTEISAVLLEIRGVEIISKGYKKLGEIPYPVVTGRIDNNTGFLLDSQGGRILKIENGELMVYNKPLNLPLITVGGNNTGGWTACYLSKDAIILGVLQGGYYRTQLVKISEQFDFTVYPPVDAEPSEENRSIASYAFNSTRLSDNKCFIIYETSFYDLARTGRIITVNNETIVYGDEVNILTQSDYESSIWRYPRPGNIISSIPGQDVIVIFYHSRKIVPFATPSKFRLIGQAIKIQNLSSILPMPGIIIEEVDEVYDSGFLLNVGVIPISSDTFLLPLIFESLPLCYRFIKISGSSFTVSSRYYPTQDSEFFELAIRGFDNNKVFGSTALIPPLI